jgi:hypothetical protein
MLHRWEPGIIWFPLCAICHCAWRDHHRNPALHCSKCKCPGFAFETLRDHPDELDRRRKIRPRKQSTSDFKIIRCISQTCDIVAVSVRNNSPEQDPIMTNHFNTNTSKIIIVTTSGDVTEFRASNGTYGQAKLTNPTLDDVAKFVMDRPSLLDTTWLTALVFNGTQMTQFGAHV